MAAMTARPATSLPSLSRTTRCPATCPSETAVHGAVRLALNFSAWMIARWVSSSPEIPMGKPR